MPSSFCKPIARLAMYAIALLVCSVTAWSQVPTPFVDIFPRTYCPWPITGTSLRTCPRNGTSPYLYDSIVNTVIPMSSSDSVPWVPASQSEQTRYSWFSLTPNSRYALTGTNVFGGWYPAGNITVELKVIAPTISTQNPNAPYTSLVSFYDSNGVTLLSIGKRGSDWTFGRRVSGSSNAGYWMTPWEPVDYYPGETYVYQDVYYTFLTDGRLQIDMFTPSQSGSGAPSYLWQESIQDGGWPQSTLGGDGRTLSFLQAKGYASIGAEYCAGCGQSIYPAGTVPTADTEQIKELVIWQNALTKDQLLANATTGFGAQPPAAGTLPCNTGMWLTSNVNTPCGSGSPRNPVPPPPPTVTSIPAAVPHVPSGVYVNPLFNDSGTGSFAYDQVTWSAPLNPPDRGYQVDLDCFPSSGTTTTSTSVNIGQNIPPGCNVYVTALYSNNPYTDTTAGYTMRSYTVIRFNPTGLTFNSPGSQTIQVSNIGNAAPSYQQYGFLDKTGAFSSNESACPNPLPAGSSCTVTISYTGKRINDRYYWKYGPGPNPSGGYSTVALVVGNGGGSE